MNFVLRPIRSIALILVLGLLSSAAPAFADSILNLGVISFDVLIPGGPRSPGTNVFNISNLTGDPSGGGFALPPDFPAFTALTFLGSSITFTFADTSTQLISLGDIAPGSLTPPLSLQFPDTTIFLSASFNATLSATSIALFGGGSFGASPSITTVLGPSSGPILVAGTDLAVIAADAVSGVPEPGSGSSVVLGLALVACLATLTARRRRHAGQAEVSPKR